MHAGREFWGPRTASAAAVEVGGRRLGSVPVLVGALAAVNEAAAWANRDRGALPAPVAAAVVGACREVMDGRWDGQFVVDVRNGGSRAAIHANVDEVLAALASHRTGLPVEAADVARGQGPTGAGLHPAALRLTTVLAAYDLGDGLREVRRALLGCPDRVADPAMRPLLDRRRREYAESIAAQEREVRDALVALHHVSLPGVEPGFAAAVTAALSDTTGLAFGVGIGSADDLAALVRTLRPVAVRLAQVAAGSEALARAAGSPTTAGDRARTETVQQLAREVVAFVLRAEATAAIGADQGPLTLATLDALSRLGVAASAVVATGGDAADRRPLAA